MHTAELIEHNIHSLKEANAVLNSMTAEQYCRPTESGRASIGKHVRHIIDHYLCLINAITNGTNNNKIAYDDRIRDQQYESSLPIARQKIYQICIQLRNLESATNGTLSNRKVKVSCSTSAEQSTSIEVDSTLQRELVFLHSHALHHFALIKMILQNQGITVDEHFGVAPSTVKHMNIMAKP